LKVVDVLVAVDQKQVLGFRLREHVGKLADAVAGVDGEQHGPDLGRGELQRHPVGHVGRPNGDLLAFLDAHRHQAAGEAVYEITELPVGQAEIPVDVDHGFGVRECGHGSIQDLSEGQGA
jgi:hypothetical protein